MLGRLNLQLMGGSRTVGVQPSLSYTTNEATTLDHTFGDQFTIFIEYTDTSPQTAVNGSHLFAINDGSSTNNDLRIWRNAGGSKATRSKKAGVEKINDTINATVFTANLYRTAVRVDSSTGLIEFYENGFRAIWTPDSYDAPDFSSLNKVNILQALSDGTGITEDVTLIKFEIYDQDLGATATRKLTRQPISLPTPPVSYDADRKGVALLGQSPQYGPLTTYTVSYNGGKLLKLNGTYTDYADNSHDPTGNLYGDALDNDTIGTVSTTGFFLDILEANVANEFFAVPAAKGSTRLGGDGEWRADNAGVTSGFFKIGINLQAALLRLQAAEQIGTLSFIDWAHGESDAIGALSTANYQAYMTTTIAEIHAAMGKTYNWVISSLMNWEAYLESTFGVTEAQWNAINTALENVATAGGYVFVDNSDINGDGTTAHMDDIGYMRRAVNESALVLPALFDVSDIDYDYMEMFAQWDNIANWYDGALADTIEATGTSVNTWLDIRGGNDITGFSGKEPEKVSGGVDFDAVNSELFEMAAGWSSDCSILIYMNTDTLPTSFSFAGNDSPSTFLLICQSGSTSEEWFRNVGTPTLYVNGVEQEITTRADAYSAIQGNGNAVIRIDGVDLSDLDQFGRGGASASFDIDGTVYGIAIVPTANIAAIGDVSDGLVARG